MNTRLYISTLIVFLFIGCVEPSDPDTKIYPTSFPGLESDILYIQDDSLFLFSKTTQSRKCLLNVSYQNAMRDIQWSHDGNAILYLDSFWDNVTMSPDSSLIYKYDIIEETSAPLGEMYCTNIWVSPDNNSLMYLADGVHYLYNWEEVSTHSLLALIAENIETDSSQVSIVTYYGIKWLDDVKLEVSCVLKTEHATNQMQNQIFKAIIDYSSVTPLLLDTLHWDYSLITYNPEKSSGVFTINNGSDARHGTWLINFAFGDTTKISNQPSFHLRFSSNGRFLAYSYRTFYGFLYEKNQYWLYDTETGDNYNIFPEADDVGEVSFSWSNNQIVCRADVNSSEYWDNIWVMNIDGSGIALISDPEFKSKNPIFRP